jgi:hypothetical protein
VYKYLRKTSKTAEQAGLSLSTIFFSWLSLHFEFINITWKMEKNTINERVGFSVVDPDLDSVRAADQDLRIWIQKWKMAHKQDGSDGFSFHRAPVSFSRRWKSFI